MPQSRKLAPTWLLGFGYLPLGINGSVGLAALPALLASAHVPEAQIALVTSLYLASGFLSIPFSPLLDWRLPRRTYAIGLTILGALCTFGELVSIHNIGLLSAFSFVGALSIANCCAAVGGWFGNLVATEKKDALGAWFNVANFGAGVVMVSFTIFAMRHLPSPFGAAVVAGVTLLVLPLYILTPCPPADRRLASESVRNFGRDVAALFKRKDVQWILLIFLAPSASFALTNTLPGFGREFHTSDEMVGVITGVGVAVAGICGSLIVPAVTKRFSPVLIYLLVGLVGAAFSLTLVAAPRDDVAFAVAILGQNLFQGAAFTAANAITFRVIGHDNPLAATQFGVLIGVTQIPLTYMQMIDGNAFSYGGVSGSFATDALISGAACVILGLVFWRRQTARAPKRA